MEQIRVSHDRFASALNSSPIVVFTQDKQLRFTWVHNSTLGFRSEELIGKTDEEVFERKEDAERLKAIKRSVLDTGKPVRTEIDIVQRGQRRCYDLHVQPILENGEVSGIVGTGLETTQHKQLESLLREQAALLDLANDAILVRDLEDRIIFWNDGARSTYGWDRADAIGKVTHELLRTGFAQPLERIREKLFSAGEWRGEIAHFARDGRSIIVDSRWVIQRDKTGNPVAVLEVNRDITESRRIRIELEERQERLRAALGASCTGTFRWNMQTNELDWDDELDLLFGLQPGKTVRSLKQFIELVHPDDRAGVIARCERCAREGADFEMEFRVPWPDGTVHWLYDRGKSFKDPQGRPLYMSGACVDITDRKETEDQLRRVESEQRAILENLSIGVWLLDETGRMVYGNQAGKDIWRGAHYVGLEDLAIYKAWWHESGQEIKNEEWAGAVVTRERKPCIDQVLDIQCFDGTRKTILNSAAPVFDAGNFVGVVVFNLDMTEQARTQKELRESHQILEQRVQERTKKLQETVADLEAVSYSLSHDMRAPLRAMYGFADSLREDYEQKLDEAGLDYLSRISRGAKRLDLLIRDVLNYSKLGKDELRLKPVNLDDFMRDLTESHAAIPGKARVTVDTPLGRVVAHEAYLSQVLSNLLDNAAKFSRPGSVPEVRVHTERFNGTVRVCVDDNGIGIAPMHHSRLFKMFGRVHPENNYEGTGIGLAMAKKAVERMGGAIGVDSEPGRGSRFWFTLPAAP